jgi:hypothetical protein
MLETLRNALLITLLVILVYVLYKRMLNAMGKNEIKERYIYFTEDSLQDENASKIGIEAKSKQIVELAVFSEDGQRIQEVFKGEIEVGILRFDLSKFSLTTGKYYCQMITDKQQDSIYFTIK